MKHVEIDMHFICECVAGDDVWVLSVPVTLQFTDTFTKGLSSSVFAEFRSGIDTVQDIIKTMGVLECCLCLCIYLH